MGTLTRNGRNIVKRNILIEILFLFFMSFILPIVIGPMPIMTDQKGNFFSIFLKKISSGTLSLTTFSMLSTRISSIVYVLDYGKHHKFTGWDIANLVVFIVSLVLYGKSGVSVSRAHLNLPSLILEVLIYFVALFIYGKIKFIDKLGSADVQNEIQKANMEDEKLNDVDKVTKSKSGKTL